MLHWLKKLIRRETPSLRRTVRVHDFSEYCTFPGAPGKIPTVEYDGRHLMIRPGGVEVFPVLWAEVLQDVDIIDGEAKLMLKEASINFIWKDPHDGEWYLGNAQHYLPKDGKDWRWEVKYFNELA